MNELFSPAGLASQVVWKVLVITEWHHFSIAEEVIQVDIR